MSIMTHSALLAAASRGSSNDHNNQQNVKNYFPQYRTLPTCLHI